MTTKTLYPPKKLFMQSPELKLFVMTLLVFTFSSTILLAQVGEVRKGERTIEFLGEKKALPQLPPLGTQREIVIDEPLPTMDFKEYDRLKREANASVFSSARPSSGIGSGSATVQNFNYAGSDRGSSSDLGFIFTPPDVNAAVGQFGQTVEVTNDHYTCFDSTGARLQDTPMSVFFGYTTKLLTDPRVVYDHIWNRFLVVEVGFSESATVQYFFIAASTSSDCTGPYNVYRLNMPLASGDFYDYPQLGFDQDAAIFTFNVFNGGFKYAEVDMVAKSGLYNARGISMPFFNNLPGTLTPNLVRDNNGATVLINNVVNTANVRLYKLANTSRNNPSITGPFVVNTGTVCGIPPSASQPGTTATLDTLDSRFQAPGTQLGNSLYNTQTCGPGLPTPRVLQVDINTNALISQDFVFRSGASNDFNPSLATNDFGDTMVNWSATDPGAGVNATTQFSGKLGAAGSTFGPTDTCFQSPTFYTQGRWGDTSGASLDMSDPTQRSWIISNETILNSFDWGTNICSVSMP